ARVLSTHTISPATPGFCPGGSVLLTGSPAVPAHAYQWTLHNVNIPGATSISYTANTVGEYSLFAYTASDTIYFDTVTVVQYAQPVASFSSGPSGQCSSTPVLFTNTSTGAATYSWNFGDPNSTNNTSTAALPAHTFIGTPGNNTQNFTVQLTATSANGCVASTTATVTTKQMPDANLLGTGSGTHNNLPYFKTCVNAASTFSFFNPSTTNNSSYVINWGDGSPNFSSATFAVPVDHLYAVGPHTMTYTVTGANGCIAVKTYYVFVGNNPAVGIGNPGNTNICTGSTLTFPITGTATNPTGTSYTVTFNEPTPWVITYSQSDVPGSVPHVFNISSCGTTSSDGVISYPNSFSARIVAENPCGISAGSIVPIYVSQKPTVTFDISPKDTVCLNTAVTLSSVVTSNYVDGTSCQAGKAVWSISPATGWSLTAGSLGNDFSQPNIDFWLSGSTTLGLSFSATGTYTIKLKTGNPKCGLDSFVRTICVNPNPVGSFTLNQNIGCAPFAVSATNASNTPICSNNTYSWSVAYGSTAGCAPATSSYTYTGGTTSGSQHPLLQFDNPGVYTVQLITKNSGGVCSAPAVTKTVTVKGKPSVTITPIPTICEGQPIHPTTSVACYASSVTHAWGFPGGTPLSATGPAPGPIIYNNAGDYIIHDTVTNECGATAVQLTLTVSEQPGFAIPVAQRVCHGTTVGPFSFTSSVGNTSFSWTNSNNAIGLASSGSGSTINSFTATNLTGSPITATITVKATRGTCITTKTFTITVWNKPAAPTASGTVTYCQNAAAVPLAATASASHHLVWYPGGASVAPTPVTSTVGTTLYQVAQVNDTTGCESNKTNINVTINASPVITSVIPTNPSACATNTGSLAINGLANGTYSVSYTKNGGAPVVSTRSSSGGVITITNLGAGTYDNITVTIAGCPSNSIGPITLSDPNPPATPTAALTATPICAGGTISLTATSATAGVTYNWSGPNSFSLTSGTGAASIPNATVAASGTYSVTATKDGCSSGAGTVDVVVDVKPSTPTVSAPAVCSGQPLNLVASSTTPGVTYSWSGPNSFSDNTSAPSIPNANASHSGTYTVTVTLGNCSSTVDVAALVKPTPAITGAPGQPTSCGTASGSIVLSGLSAGTYTINYERNNVPVTTSQTIAGSTLTIGSLTAGTYSNISVTLDGCPSNTIGPFILADPNPPAAPQPLVNGPICSGSNLQLSISAPLAGGSYNWTGPNSFSSTQQAPQIAGASVAATGIYTVTVTLAGCTSAVATVSATVNQTPAQPVISSNSPVCSGTALTLAATTTTPGAIIWSWTGPNSFSSAAPDVSFAAATVAQAGNYTVTATLGSCSNDRGIAVAVKPTPVITAVLLNHPTQCATTTGRLLLQGLSANTVYTYTYTRNGTPLAGSGTADASGSLTIANLGAGNYDAIVVNLDGCPSNTVGPFALNDPNPPAAPTLASNGPLCAGAPLALNASSVANATYAWSGPNSFTSTLQNPSIPASTIAAAGVYSVTVTVDNCTSQPATVNVVVHPLPSLPAVVTPVAYCMGAPSAALTATSGPGAALNWYSSASGGLALPAAPVPATTVSGSSSWFVSQTSSNGCEGQRAELQVIVHPDANARYTFSRDTACWPFLLPIQNTSTASSNSSYNWFADGVLFSSATATAFPGYTLNNPSQQVTIKLVAVSAFGCKPDSTEHSFFTLPKPQAMFSATPTSGCAPLRVNFTNTTALIDTFGYSWDFGNGQFSNLQQPGTIVFDAAPTANDTIYVVKLRAYNGCDTSLFTLDIHVSSKPKALFTPDQTIGCSPMDVVFTNNSLGFGNSYTWNFDDGTTVNTASATAVTHTFNTGVRDTFYVKLYASNGCGIDSAVYSVVVLPNPIRLFMAVNGTQQNGCAPHAVQFINNSSGATGFQWNFDDGNTLSTTGNIDTITHVFAAAGAYNVKLTAFNGCTDTTMNLLVNVYEKPEAAFTANRYIACLGDTIRFNNVSTGATSYLWTFGDGGNSTLANPEHVYAAAGIFTVQLEAQRLNPTGSYCTDTETVTVEIRSSLAGAMVVSDSVSSCVPFTVTFADPNGPASSASWNFGDGNIGSGSPVAHTYTDAGVYTATLSSVSTGGCTYTAQRTIRVNAPAGAFTYAGGYVCGAQAVRFEATVSATDTLLWSFGDGSTQATLQPFVYHTYANPGVYLPSVTLATTAGCHLLLKGVDSIRVDRIINGFAQTQARNCGSTDVTFTDTAHVYFGRTAVTWDFGDGTGGSGSPIVHRYTNSGLYQVRQIVFSTSGCSDTLYRNINVQVNSVPVAAIAAAAQGCTNVAHPLTANVQSVDPIGLYQWSINGTVVANANAYSPVFTAAGTYSIRLVVGTINGCFDTALLTIQVRPSPAVSATADFDLCLGRSGQLNASGVGVVQWAWTPIQGLSCTTCPNPVATPNATTPYVVTGTNAFGCPGTDTVVITIHGPIHMTVSDDDTICIGQSVQLLASGAASYVWRPDQYLDNDSIPNPVATPPVTIRYQVVGYDGWNCYTDTASVLVAVGQYPTVNLGPDLVLATGVQRPLVSTVTNGPIRNWLWAPSADLSCSTCPLPTATIRNDVLYRVQVTNEYGCSAADSLFIKAFCKEAQVFMPNAFSPDGDGVNDVFMVQGSGILRVKTFRVFNRWGELVFEKNEVPPNDPRFGWDGRVIGRPAVPDVYVYTVEVLCENGTPYTYKGNVTILK
ncbi:MAG: PKD domain-containing protein, partial [Chitinophagaceae bacterium]